MDLVISEGVSLLEHLKRFLHTNVTRASSHDLIFDTYFGAIVRLLVNLSHTVVH